MAKYVAFAQLALVPVWSGAFLFIWSMECVIHEVPGLFLQLFIFVCMSDAACCNDI